MATMAENVIVAGSENCPPMLEKVDIYTLINHFQTTKEIWDRVKKLMEGTKITKQERESLLYDEFDKFTSEPEESIHSYYLRYAKLINVMNMIPMSMSPMQINSKFVNHLQPEWSRFVSAAKQARNLHKSPPLQSYAPPVVQQPPTFQPDIGFVVLTFLPTDDPIANLNKSMIFLSSAYSSRYPPTNNQLRPIQELKLQFKMAKLRFIIFKVDSLKVMQAVLERIKLHEQGLSIQLEMQGQINQG
ncbi:hypothetical protein Tco_0705444 [Tanacetum coccineum]|uniref:Integrase, catalytic region, zinc finger, CCHC-type, peptidase aspartic, catalytic n=1 Tax=Tanacetum coccineum TaxID=301880 RepID=A0ABQ4Y6L5_9ASTR